MLDNKILVFVIGALVGYYLLDRLPIVPDLLP